MAGTLTCRALFGVNGDVRGSVLVPEEEAVVYPAGGFLVRYNTRTRAQDAVPLTGSGGVAPAAGSAGGDAGGGGPPPGGASAGALALALSPSRRTLAVVERSSLAGEGATLSLYAARNMAKKKAFVLGAAGAALGGAVAGLAFSPDEGLVAVLGAGPAPTLLLVSADRGRVLAAVPANDLVHGGAGGADPALAAALADAGLEGLLPGGAGGAGGAGGGAALEARVEGCAFSTGSPVRLVVWGSGGALALCAVEEAHGEGGGSLGWTVARVPPPPSWAGHARRVAAAAADAAGAAAAEAGAAAAAAHGLGAAEAAAAAAAADDAGAVEELAAATAAVPEGEAPTESARWLMAASLATAAREAAASTAAAAAAARAAADAAAAAAFTSAAAASLAESTRFTAAGWLPPAANPPPAAEVQSELLVAAARSGELLVLTPGGDVLGSVEASAPPGKPVLVVAGYARGDGGFVTAGEGGALRVYERARVASAMVRVTHAAPVAAEDEAGAHDDGASAAGSASGGGGGRVTLELPPSTAPDGGRLAREAGLWFGLAHAATAAAPGVESDDTIRALALSPSGERAVLVLADTTLLVLDVANGALKEPGASVTPLGPPAHAPEARLTAAAGGPPSPLSGQRKARGRTPAPGAAGADAGGGGGADAPAGAAERADSAGTSRGGGGGGGGAGAGAGAPPPPAALDVRGGCVVVSLDAAVRKPLVVTAGSDNTVRVWNFVERSCEAWRAFADAPTAVAMHPSGGHVLVGFPDRLKQFDVLGDELREAAEWPVRGATEVRYARGGHLFAAAAAAGYAIQLYDAGTGAYLQSLRGHGGRVTGLSWAYNDATLLSCGSDGALYEWSVADGKRTREVLLKGARFTGAAASRDGGTVLAVGEVPAPPATPGAPPAYFVREVDLASGAVTAELALPERPAGLAVTAAAPRLCFVGAGGQAGDGTYGVVRSLVMPLAGAAAAAAASGAGAGDAPAGSPPPPAWATFPAAGLGVSKLMLSYDDAWLFVAGTDGSVGAFEVKDAAGRPPPGEAGVRMAWLDEAALAPGDLIERAGALKELRDRVSELRASSDYALRVREAAFTDAVTRATEAFEADLEAEREALERTTEARAAAERDFNERQGRLESAHRAEVQKREVLYQGKIMAEVERFAALQAEVDAARAHFAAAARRGDAAAASALAAATAEADARLAATRDKRARLEREVAGARRDWDESRAQAEADVDTEVEGLKAAYQAKLDVERDASLRFKGENGIMRKKFATLAKEIEDNREAIAASLARAAHLRGVVDALDRDILVLRGVIHDKDAVIAEREKRIYELKKKNQELEKFKFVLDVKIKELKAQIEPREAEIAALKKQVREVNAELEAYHASNSTLDAAIGDLRRDIDALGARGLETRGRLNRKGAAVRDFAGDLHLAVQAASRPEDFARGLAGLVATYVTGRVAPAPTDLAVVEESERQRARLEGTLRALRARADAAAAAHAKGVAGLVAENMTLIEAGRSLRAEIGRLRAEAKAEVADAARASIVASFAASASAATVPAGAARGPPLAGGGGSLLRARVAAAAFTPAVAPAPRSPDMSATKGTGALSPRE